MRLGTKIIIGFICVSLLLAVVGFISDHFTDQIRQEQLRSVKEVSEVVIYTGEMERSLFQSLIFLNGIREAYQFQDNNSNVQELPGANELRSKFDQQLIDFEESFEQLQVLLGVQDKLPADINKLVNSYTVYRSISIEWLSLASENQGPANMMFINSIEPYFRNNIIPEITKLRKYVLAIQNEENLALDQSLSRAAYINYIATLLSVFLALTLAIYIYRSIANPLSRLSIAAKKLGEGKLDERVELSSKDELGELAESFNTMAEGLQEKTVSTDYLDNIIESIQEALFVTDNEGLLVRANTAAAEMVGYDIQELLKQPVQRFYNMEEKHKVYLEHKEKNKSFEFSIIDKEQNKIPVLFSESKLVDTQGKQVGMVSVASDISDQIRREAEIRISLKEKEVMLAEIHHRVKNNLAVISGLLQLQRYSTDNEAVANALTDSQMRIQSIALVHEMLYKSESLAFIQYDQYVEDLLQTISSMNINEEKEITVKTDLEPISLMINQAVPCSLLMNELVVNAYKHAFNNLQEGEIHVKMFEQDENVTVTISDSGIGFDINKFTAANTLGATLIKTLANQLSGDFKILNNSSSGGSVFRLDFVRQQ